MGSILQPKALYLKFSMIILNHMIDLTDSRDHNVRFHVRTELLIVGVLYR